MFGEALAENIGDNQKVKTAITRGIIDNMARSNNGQIGIRNEIWIIATVGCINKTVERLAKMTGGGC